MTVVDVEYTATRYLRKKVSKNKRTSESDKITSKAKPSKASKGTPAPVYVAWALAENEEDSDGNIIDIEDVSSDRYLLQKHCYQYEASDFHVPSGTIPYNGDCTVPALAQDPFLNFLPKRLRRDKSDLAQQLKQCILRHGGPPKLMDGSTDPATGKVVRLSWVINELAKLVEDETATAVIIHSQMTGILEWYKEEQILEGFREMFPEFEYPLTSAKFNFSQFSTAFLRWVVVSASSIRTTTTTEQATPMSVDNDAQACSEADTTTQRKIAVLS